MSCWPDKRQTLLLTAGLAQSQKAMGAWKEWVSGLDTLDDTSPQHTLSSIYDQIDPGSQRLLPLVYKNLRSVSDSDYRLSSLKNLYKFCWCENQVFADHCKKVVSLLQQESIEPLFLKGIPLSILFYKDFAVRPMSDFDFAVQKKDINRALAVLSEHGWIDMLTREPFTKVDGLLTSSRNLINSDEQEMDIHWNVLKVNSDWDKDNIFWRDRQTFKIGEIEAYSLSPGNHILQVLVHGMAWNPVPNLRWIPDVAYIVKNAEVNWEEVLENATLTRTIVFLKEALPYLKKQFDVEIPEEVVSQLSSAYVSKNEIGYYKHRTSSSQSYTEFLKAKYHYRKAYMDSVPLIKTLVSIIEHYKANWIPHKPLFLLPIFMFMRLMRWSKDPSLR